MPELISGLPSTLRIPDPPFDQDLSDEPYESNLRYLEDVLGYIRVCLLRYALSGTPEALVDYRETQRLAEAFRAHIEERSRLSAQERVFLPLPFLFHSFQLNPAERFVVAFAFAVEMDDTLQAAASALAAQRGADRPADVAFALKVYYDREAVPLDCMESLRAQSALAAYFLAPDDGFGGIAKRPARLEARMVDFIFSASVRDFAAGSYTTIFYPEEPLPELLADREITGQMADYAAGVADRADAQSTKMLFFFHGQEGCGKKLQVKKYCQLKRFPVLFVDLKELVPEMEAENPAGADRRLAGTLCRETVLRRAAICFVNFQAVLEAKLLSRFLELLHGATRYVRTVFLLSEAEWKPRQRLAGCVFVPIALKELNPLERLGVWERQGAAYPLDPGLCLSDIANKFSFSIGQIGAALEAAAFFALWNKHERITEEDLYTGCYHQVDHKLSGIAQRIRPHYRWDDLILHESQKQIIKIACDQVRYRHTVYHEWGFDAKISYGRGVSILFNGPPGTGKTMAAEVMANDLHLELYKVDLSAIVSKYIGETEKNINTLFEQARKSDAILFFDEADALFAKRTEVKDSHDKNSNMETSFLLQRMEEYSGIIVLTTNYLNNFDAAFRRRIKLIVTFEMPNEANRKIIWQSVFPQGAPRSAQLDFDFLAQKFALSGSSIKTIALNASFIAASEGQEIDMSAIIRALQLEYIKNGLILRKDELAEYSTYMV